MSRKLPFLFFLFSTLVLHLIGQNEKWDQVIFPDMIINSIAINDKGVILASGNERGAYGLCDLYRSLDDGKTWEKIKSAGAQGSDFSLFYGTEIEVSGDLFLFQGMNQRFFSYFSDDNGSTWKELKAPPVAGVHYSFGPDIMISYDKGIHEFPTYLKREPSLNSWKDMGRVPFEEYNRFFNEKYDCIYVGRNQYYLAGANSGKFPKINRPTKGPASKILSVYNYYVTAGFNKPVYTGSPLQVSYDNMQTWAYVGEGNHRNKGIFRTCNEDELFLHGVDVLRNSMLYYTKDGGKTWVSEYISDQKINNIRELDISKQGTGFAIISSDFILSGKRSLFRKEHLSDCMDPETSESDDDHYSITFLAYPRGKRYLNKYGKVDTSQSGHVFVAFSKNKEIEKVKGFSPVMWSEVKGKVDENTDEGYLAGYHDIDFCVDVSKAIYDKALAHGKEDYILGLDDCVSYADDIADIANLETPTLITDPIDFSFPMSFVRYLDRNNRDQTSRNYCPVIEKKQVPR